jgi:uncharacterized protein
MEMNIDIIKLNSGILKEIPIDISYTLTDDEKKQAGLIDMKNLKITGTIEKNILGNVSLNLEISGIMVLECAITLKPVDYPFTTNVSGEYEELLEEIGEIGKNSLNTIDIFPIIWENILLEVPLRVVSDDAKDIKLSGDGWSLVTDEGQNNNPFAELLNDSRE